MIPFATREITHKTRNYFMAYEIHTRIYIFRENNVIHGLNIGYNKTEKGIIGRKYCNVMPFDI